MEKQVVQKRWKLIFWGLTAAAVALLAPGLGLTLEPALFLGLGGCGILHGSVYCCDQAPVSCLRRLGVPPGHAGAGGHPLCLPKVRPEAGDEMR